MERRISLFCILLFMLHTCYAQQNDTVVQPTAPQTVSIERLISSQENMKKSIEEQDRNIKELREQLDSKLSNLYLGLALFAAAWTIVVLSFQGLFGRVWEYLMYSRKKRKVEKGIELMASELRNMTALMQMLNASLEAIKSDVAAVEKEKKPPQEEKPRRSLLDRLLRRNHDAE